VIYFSVDAVGENGRRLGLVDNKNTFASALLAVYSILRNDRLHKGSINYVHGNGTIIG